MSRAFATAWRYWGVWPSLVMLLCQWEAGRLLDRKVPTTVSLITLAGTLTIYGADRWLERRRLRRTEARHHAGRLAGGLVSAAIMALAAAALPGLNGAILLWLVLLAVMGSAYLMITSRLLTTFFLLKELLGTLCFTILVWGWAWPLPALPPLAFSLIGLSNFLWSGAMDRERDRANGLLSLAVSFPLANRLLAGAVALAAVWLFYRLDGLNSVFLGVALIHLLWCRHLGRNIDLAFLPLLIVPFLAF